MPTILKKTLINETIFLSRILFAEYSDDLLLLCFEILV